MSLDSQLHSQEKDDNFGVAYHVRDEVQADPSLPGSMLKYAALNVSMFAATYFTGVELVEFFSSRKLNFSVGASIGAGLVFTLGLLRGYLIYEDNQTGDKNERSIK